MITKLGINDQIVAKSEVPKSDVTVRKDLNAGNLALGILYVSDIRPPGDEFDVVGVLPRKVAPPNPILGFVTTKAKDPAAAKALLDYLISPDAQAIFKAEQFDPRS